MVGGGLGGELGHLLDGCGVEVTAWEVLFPQKAGVLTAVSACAHGGPLFSGFGSFCPVGSLVVVFLVLLLWLDLHEGYVCRS